MTVLLQHFTHILQLWNYIIANNFEFGCPQSVYVISNLYVHFSKCRFSPSVCPLHTKTFVKIYISVVAYSSSGCTAVHWLALTPHGKKVHRKHVHSQHEAFLCEVRMFSLCLCGCFLGTLVPPTIQTHAS